MNQTLQDIPISQLREAAHNPRRHFNDDSLKELAESILAVGILNPLTVRPAQNGKASATGYEIAAGHRRYRAAKLAKLKELPCLVREMDDATFLEVLSIENLQREDVHPLDEALGYQQLIAECGYDVPAIAVKVGKSETYVYQRMKLVDLCEMGRTFFWNESINAGHAVLLARLPEEQQVAVIEEFWDRQFGGVPTIAEVQAYIEEYVLLALDGARFPKKDADLVPGAGACPNCPKRTGATPALFPEVGKKDLCLDPDCFHRKQEAFVNRTISEHNAANPQSPMLRLAGSYSRQQSYGDKPAGIIEQYKVREIGKKDKPCEAATQAIIAYGADLGKVSTVCADPQCPEHGRVNSQYVEDPAVAKQEREKARLEKAVNARGRMSLIPGALEFVIEGLLERCLDDGRKELCKHLDLKVVKGEYRFDYAGALRTHAQGLISPEAQIRFLVELATFGCYESYTWSNKFWEMAAPWGLSKKAIEAAVAAEQKAAKPKGKPKKAGAK